MVQRVQGIGKTRIAYIQVLEGSSLLSLAGGVDMADIVQVSGFAVAIFP